MANDHRDDILDILKFELGFLEHGGYGRSVRTPWKPTSVFQDSPSCLNFNDPARPLPCADCALMQFVPSESQFQDVPCHHIPVGPHGETIEDLGGNQMATEESMRNWLRATIERLEKQRDEKTA
jgi:hypothetical protein